MPKISRYLITTADERTWKFDCPSIFLGEWCRLYSRKHIWESMDSIIAEPYGLNQAQKDADYFKTKYLEDKLYPILSELLNQYHGTNHGVRYWKIVLGHWFRRYLEVMINRVRTINQCLESYQFIGTTVFSAENYMLATQDSEAALWAFNDDIWNNVLYTRILELLKVTSLPVNMIDGCDADSFYLPVQSTKVSIKRRFFRWGHQFVDVLSGLFSRVDDALIINSYLSKKEEVRLQLALGQIPQLFVSPELEMTKKPDPILRQNLSDKISKISNDTLSNIICSLIFELLPVCFLEGYSDLTKKVQQFSWPLRPKFIFTSNNFDTDELFKLWAASKIEFGSTYIVGQHGNNYGTHRYLQSLVEEVTSDKFLTWGWVDDLPQHVSAFIFKPASRKRMRFNSKGGLLLIELHMPHRITTWDGIFEFGEYFLEQKKFVGKLNKTVRRQLTVRLHGGHQQARWFEIERWGDNDETINIDVGIVNIEKLIAKSRLIVHSYDSTGILETLAQNIPTLAFWRNEYDHLRDSAVPYYQLLADAGILHLSVESIADKVNQVWDDVEGWWTQSDVQNARKQFCRQYARTTQKPVSYLKNILTCS